MPPRHLYVHVPFCARRCSYCDFSIAVRRVVPVAEYVGALARELALRASADAAWELDTLYFGGGTPSRLGAEGVAHTLDALRERVRLAPGAEVTLEANPDDVTPEAARAWQAAGVNRLSIGSQSFDEGVLRWMHRSHGADQIERAVAAARDAGIHNLSLDLIFALPAALERDWRRDLERTLALAPSHVSLYGLTVEPGTPLGRWRDRGAVQEAPEESYERDFLLAHELLAAAGYEHYEVSNYALPGARSRHNSVYWSGASYEGLGPSAHAYDGRTRRWNVAPYAAWVRRLEGDGDPTEDFEVLTEEQREAERVYLGLRTTAGLPVEPSMAARVARWEREGWAGVREGRVRLTPLGWLRLDALTSDLTSAGSRS
ncbi:MAG TPA: radical SAM family heme chaperone HemW [Gemmatimonadaceae bacterium]|nr:radical SAM family heme chaperone HemW [Gemmatimonadaceae bacterium]